MTLVVSYSHAWQLEAKCHLEQWEVFFSRDGRECKNVQSKKKMKIPEAVLAE